MLKLPYAANEKLTLNQGLKNLILFGIVVLVGGSLISILITQFVLQWKLGASLYSGIMNGLGLAFGCYVALKLDGKMNNRIRLVVAIVLSILTMVGLSFGVGMVFH